MFRLCSPNKKCKEHAKSLQRSRPYPEVIRITSVVTVSLTKMLVGPAIDEIISDKG